MIDTQSRSANCIRNPAFLLSFSREELTIMGRYLGSTSQKPKRPLHLTPISSCPPSITKQIRLLKSPIICRLIHVIARRRLAKTTSLNTSNHVVRKQPFLIPRSLIPARSCTCWLHKTGKYEDSSYYADVTHSNTTTLLYGPAFPDRTMYI